MDDLVLVAAMDGFAELIRNCSDVGNAQTVFSLGNDLRTTSPHSNDIA